ncbi:hypothetical protein [Clostridium polynesiense]|uniref:hypothetical protein n=1 Tax=Clostridium polynesiense TaxID=1325933 RepID=UPI00058F667F|nr:hypothetical protein [Clostridium polynesiense]
MSKIIRTSIILYDSYNNVLIVQKGKKSEEQWGLIGKELKGKETCEKCITKAVDKDLDCAIFDLSIFGEYPFNEQEGETVLVYTGIIRQYIVAHKSINQLKWINKNDLDSYNLLPQEKEILTEFFNNINQE